MVAADGLAVVHGVECGDLVDAHGGHLEQASDLVHDADAGEAVLSLTEVEEGHDGRLFVLWGVSGEDFLHELLVHGVEFEWNVEVVLRRVAVLSLVVSGGKVGTCRAQAVKAHTTWRVSLRMAGVEAKARRGCLDAARSTLLPLRNAIGASFEAMLECVSGGMQCMRERQWRVVSMKLPRMIASHLTGRRRTDACRFSQSRVWIDNYCSSSVRYAYNQVLDTVSNYNGEVHIRHTASGPDTLLLLQYEFRCLDKSG